MNLTEELQKKSALIPRIIIAALKGGSGKTIFSVGIAAALKESGKSVAVYKKGPDYIDAGWLALAADKPCYNLDNFLIPNYQIKNSFISNSLNADIAIIEGNRGIFDGLDTDGTTSTAGLAKLLDAPVILCLDCTKTTRTIAAVLYGCLMFDPNLKIKGVILNRVGGARHEQIIRKSIEKYCKIPVLGAIPKLKNEAFPERHMGLVPTHEHEWAESSAQAVSSIVKKYIDIDKVVAIAEDTSKLIIDNTIEHKTHPIKVVSKHRIGVIRDSAFQFYYQENLDALCAYGADIVFISPLKDADISDDISALYIGGGFPETHAAYLAANNRFKNKIKLFAEAGMPIYGECGGLMYLSESIRIEDALYPMTGVLPIQYSFSKRPAAHGYTIIKVQKNNPYFKKGMIIRGHEFHYSKIEKWSGSDETLAFDMTRGVGLVNKKDGACYKNVLGTYTHIHSAGNPVWAESMVKLAANYSKK
ncbi:MAG: cobyrinate a,c-diamide synthase [Deltaproteobacteria bacterium]|nr:cobyrinate a,c-diamide synthase [Deltaproteobacteria bacterium]